MLPLIVKLVGSVLVVAAGGGLGLLVVSNLVARPRQLRDFQSALQMLETEIQYAASPLPEAMDRVGRAVGAPVGMVLERAASYLTTGGGLVAADGWELALREARGTAALTREDIDILLAFGAFLGRSDREDQVKHLRLARERLHRQELKAEEDRMRNERLWRYLGFLGALALVVVLL